MPETYVFDMDGVLLQSNGLKARAFYRAALRYGEAAAEWLVEFHRRAGSISREDRVRALFDQHLLREPELGECAVLLQEIAAELEEGYRTVPLLPGVERFLADTPGPKVVVSGVEQNELESILHDRGLAPQFEYIHGGNKHELFPRLLEVGAIRLPAVYFGDTEDDQRAATAAGLDFVLVLHDSEWADPPADIASIRDFHDLLAAPSAEPSLRARVGRDGYAVVQGERRYVGRSLAGAEVTF